jgi:hypothetical protein
MRRFAAAAIEGFGTAAPCDGPAALHSDTRENTGWGEERTATERSTEVHPSRPVSKRPAAWR